MWGRGKKAGTKIVCEFATHRFHPPFHTCMVIVRKIEANCRFSAAAARCPQVRPHFAKHPVRNFKRAGDDRDLDPQSQIVVCWGKVPALQSRCCNANMREGNCDDFEFDILSSLLLTLLWSPKAPSSCDHVAIMQSSVLRQRGVEPAQFPPYRPSFLSSSFLI